MEKLPENKVFLKYYFDGEEWEISVLITEDDIKEYYGMPIHKDLFGFIDFDRLMEQDYGFSAWIRKKHEDDAKLEFQRYSL